MPYTWSNTSVKEKVGLFAGEPIRGRLIGGEIWYTCSCTDMDLAQYHDMRGILNIIIIIIIILT